MRGHILVDKLYCQWFQGKVFSYFLKTETTDRFGKTTCFGIKY